MTLPIHPSARKHGISDDDILHAIRDAVVTADVLDEDGEETEDIVLHIGPSWSGELLEIIERSGIAIHAMPLRTANEPLLRGYGESDD